MQLATQNFEQYLKEQSERVNVALDALMPAEDAYPEVIHQSMRYSIFAGGKRFRPVLTLATCEACGGDSELALKTAAAIEMIHTYSLIHDDLPAMDNDDYRRGQLSNHKKYGEDMAILSGDCLLSLAFEVMDPEVVACIAKAIGSFGVVGGQAVDIQLAKGQEEMTESLIQYIHTHKTGALIAISCRVGAILAGASSDVVEAMHKYGQGIGFAFQIIDDVFDGDNYAELWGEEKARRRALEEIDRAKMELGILQDKNNREILESLADFVAFREE